MTHSGKTCSTFSELDLEGKGWIEWNDISRLDLPESEKQDFWRQLAKHDADKNLKITPNEFKDFEKNVLREKWGFLRSEVFLMAFMGLLVHVLNVLPIYGYLNIFSAYYHITKII